MPLGAPVTTPPVSSASAGATNLYAVRVTTTIRATTTILENKKKAGQLVTIDRGMYIGKYIGNETTGTLEVAPLEEHLRVTAFPTRENTKADGDRA